MEEKKYVLTDETCEFEGHILHRIQAIRDFNNVWAGDLGGWVENQDNLCHSGTCWIYHNAKVYEHATVGCSATVRDNTKIHGHSVVTRNATVCSNAEVSGQAVILDHAAVSDFAKIGGYARIGGEARVYDQSFINDNAMIGGNVIISKNAQIFGTAVVSGHAKILSNASISKIKDFRLIGPIGSRNDYVTFYYGSDHDIYVATGCFNGTLHEFEEKVKERYPYSCDVNRLEYESAIQFIRNLISYGYFRPYKNPL